MRSIFRILTVAFCLSSMPSHGVAQVQGSLTRDLNLHAGPSASSERIATLKAKSKVTLLEPAPQNGFFHVRSAENLEGWILARDVKLAAAAPSISRKLVRRPASQELEPHKPGLAAAACQPDLASCPDTGCAAAGSPHGLMNQLKRRVPSGSASAGMLTFDDFNSLQQQADNLVGEDHDLSADDRAKLQGLTVAAGQVSEGDVVTVLAYL